MNSNDFVKFLTVQFVERLEQPKQKKLKNEKTNTNNFATKWFGLIPVSLKIYAKKFKKNA